MEGDDIRRIVIQQSYRAHVGHIGSALSIADIVATVFDTFPRIGVMDDDRRPRFVLSKGHAALALYAALFLKGHIDQAKLDTYCANNSELGVHPERRDWGIDIATGSLGMGVSIATGMALGSKMRGEYGYPVICIMSDAEMNEGVVWEAAQFAAHHNLHNLRIIADINGQQAFGHTWQVLEQSALRKRWKMFGWHARWANGHDPLDLVRAIRAADPHVIRDRPHIILARTVFGNGVDFMEGQIPWHYLPLDQGQYEEAMAQLAEGPLLP
jgi:transketolase